MRRIPSSRQTILAVLIALGIRANCECHRNASWLFSVAQHSSAWQHGHEGLKPLARLGIALALEGSWPMLAFAGIRPFFFPELL